MTIEMRPSKRKEIRNLVLVISGGVACAMAIALFMLYFYSPTGRYYAKNVLLSPQIVSQISYPEKNPKTGITVRYLFDSFVFAFYDPAKKEWSRANVKPDVYREFYDAIAEDLSIEPVSEELRQLFRQSPPTTLTVKMRHGNGSEEKVSFQQVDFAEGQDYYRVQLREQASGNVSEGWAYFFHPGIERYARALFYP
ncbi:MAG: hypothetical protein LLG04_10150 [Parachlamydia sp.]|nr:hypothetical protein [Parachlamydia sp.]